MTKYERGASCGKGQHTWEDHGSYSKCTVCGASRTKGGRATSKAGGRPHEQKQHTAEEEFWRRARETAGGRTRWDAYRERAWTPPSRANKLDPYEVLGVSRNATADDVKLRYRQLAKEWHPDVTSHDKAEATEKFKDISNAYDEVMRFR